MGVRDSKEEWATYQRNWRRQNPGKQAGYSRKSQLGISLLEYEKLLEQQSNACAVCKQPETRMPKNTSKASSLAVDHDHETGEVRGLLCFKCNMALGLLDDSLETISLLLEYRKRFA